MFVKMIYQREKVSTDAFFFFCLTLRWQCDIFKVHFLRSEMAGLNHIGTFFGNDSFPKAVLQNKDGLEGCLWERSIFEVFGDNS